MFRAMARQALKWKIIKPTITIRSFQKLNKSRMRNVDMKTLNSALKPFFFLVHPDLFGNFPDMRKVNEDSLMALNSFLQAYVTKDRQPTLKKISLKFFIRDRHYGPDSVSEILVNLYDTSPVVIVENILTSAGLPGVMNNEKQRSRSQKQSKNDCYNYSNNPWYEDKKQASKTLVNFLERNSSVANIQLNRTLELRSQNMELIKKICTDFQLRSLEVESNWRISLQNGYLKNLYERLCRNKNEVMKAAGWKVVLSSWAGVDANGAINLNIEDEPLNWIKLLNSAEMFSTLLEDTNNLVSSISAILGGLGIARTVHGKKNYHLKHFHRCLDNLYPKLSCRINGPTLDLSNHKAVLSTSPVEEAAILPNGSFIIPLSMTGHEIISFLNTLGGEAKNIRNIYESQLAKEKDLINHCMAVLKLRSLTKSPNIEPSQMINCCENLLDLNYTLTQDLEVKVDQYYYMSADGLLTIPWNWTIS